MASSAFGAPPCAGCHAGIAARQAKSAHALALSHAADHPLAGQFAQGSLTRSPGYKFEVSGPKVRITDAQDRMELPLEWAFGAGVQAVTFVTRVNQDWYVEHFASFYPALHGWAATPGQSALKPATLPEAAGVLYKVADPSAGIAGCFECHSTGPVRFDGEGQVTVTEAGVHCESCHGAGPDHKRLVNPARLSPSGINDLCGRCHRPPAAAGVQIDWNYAWNVRHQPVYLSQSACFRKSGKLSCVTCHDPHEPAAKKPAAFYNQRCSACHSPTPACSTNCIDCHMPMVSPQPPLRFTNHWIGVYKPGAMLRPAIRRAGKS